MYDITSATKMIKLTIKLIENAIKNSAGMLTVHFFTVIVVFDTSGIWADSAATQNKISVMSMVLSF